MTIGKYQILGTLGSGGMGKVYLGQDPDLGRKVAIKTVLAAAEGQSPDELAKDEILLKREAKAAANLSHPAIVRVWEFLRTESLCYIVMEFVDGKSLDRLHSFSEPVPPQEALRILKECASALDYAHQSGIVHRDIKPANIMIEDKTGAVRLTDFGIAKFIGSKSTFTKGKIIGTPEYLSPEQVLAAADLDGRSDQFSLAVVAHRMLTGRPLYNANSIPSLLLEVVHSAPPSARQLNPALPATVDPVLYKALSKAPNGRYSTCSDFVDALGRALSAKLDVKGNPPPRGVAPNVVKRGPTSPQREEPGRYAQRTFQVVIGALLVGLVIAIVVMVVHGTGQAFGAASGGNYTGALVALVPLGFVAYRIYKVLNK